MLIFAWELVCRSILTFSIKKDVIIYPSPPPPYSDTICVCMLRWGEVDATSAIYYLRNIESQPKSGGKGLISETLPT